MSSSERLGGETFEQELAGMQERHPCGRHRNPPYAGRRLCSTDKRQARRHCSAFTATDRQRWLCCTRVLLPCRATFIEASRQQRNRQASVHACTAPILLAWPRGGVGPAICRRHAPFLPCLEVHLRAHVQLPAVRVGRLQPVLFYARSCSRAGQQSKASRCETANHRGLSCKQNLRRNVLCS